MPNKDYIEIGPAPCEEECAQVGSDGYHARAREECRRFIEAIRAKLGPEPDGARLAAKSFSHDFGTYHEVVCWYDEGNEAAAAYAFRCEAEAPTHWPDKCARTACGADATSGPHRDTGLRYCNGCRILINDAAGFELVPAVESFVVLGEGTGRILAVDGPVVAAMESPTEAQARLLQEVADRARRPSASGGDPACPHDDWEETGCGTVAHFGRCRRCGASLTFATGPDRARDSQEPW